ncbi:hypothetical protein [Roseisalinus antarcticus]|uniref:Uncharacterized protein n=1 Tax=Roseisalinus antarcticus TaxID=254357 RepID=A0A1Y5TKC3_9RHOB|nr:hypothetical protein [Roseisalinus antarcticus]SLN65637.1 hypothetical protein ROA7023_03087 [Roseisalinus antarcticus]
MGITEDIADDLARETIDAMDKLGDDRLFEEIAKSIGASSQTTEEAFLTAIRVRLAERRARKLLAERLAAGSS